MATKLAELLTFKHEDEDIKIEDAHSTYPRIADIKRGLEAVEIVTINGEKSVIAYWVGDYPSLSMRNLGAETDAQVLADASKSFEGLEHEHLMINGRSPGQYDIGYMVSVVALVKDQDFVNAVIKTAKEMKAIEKDIAKTEKQIKKLQKDKDKMRNNLHKLSQNAFNQ